MRTINLTAVGLYFRFAGGEKWPISIALSVAAGAVFYALFDYFLHLPFPRT